MHFQLPELTEAIAMRHALKFAEEAGFRKVIVASDCATLISKVKCLQSDRSHIGVLVHDIKSRASKFNSCTFTHVNRCCNMAAHVLARSSEYDQGSWWFNLVPDVIRTIVCTEQSLIEWNINCHLQKKKKHTKWRGAHGLVSLGGIEGNSLFSSNQVLIRWLHK